MPVTSAKYIGHLITCPTCQEHTLAIHRWSIDADSSVLGERSYRITRSYYCSCCGTEITISSRENKLGSRTEIIERDNNVWEKKQSTKRT